VCVCVCVCVCQSTVHGSPKKGKNSSCPAGEEEKEKGAEGGRIVRRRTVGGWVEW
jgi:hypothetical protein